MSARQAPDTLSGTIKDHQRQLDIAAKTGGQGSKYARSGQSVGAVSFAGPINDYDLFDFTAQVMYDMAPIWPGETGYPGVRITRTVTNVDDGTVYETDTRVIPTSTPLAGGVTRVRYGDEIRDVAGTVTGQSSTTAVTYCTVNITTLTDNATIDVEGSARIAIEGAAVAPGVVGVSAIQLDGSTIVTETIQSVTVTGESADIFSARNGVVVATAGDHVVTTYYRKGTGSSANTYAVSAGHLGVCVNEVVNLWP